MSRLSKDLRHDLTFTMPFSNVLHLPFIEKVRATMLAGFSELTLQPQEVQRIIAEGLTLKDMTSIAADNGVTISRLDPLCVWNPNWEPKNMNASFIADHTISAEDFFALCSQLGCSHMSLNATFANGTYSHQQQVDYYAAICQRAFEYGLICDLEPIPMWGVRTLEQGWEIIRQAGSVNGGLVFDTLHFIRSKSTLKTLSNIPGDKIHCVQICDGSLPLPSLVTLEEDCFRRMWPGQGDFPLQPVISTLSEIGGLHQVGPEVFSDANAAMSAKEIAFACRSSLSNFSELLQ